MRAKPILTRVGGGARCKTLFPLKRHPVSMVQSKIYCQRLLLKCRHVRHDVRGDPWLSEQNSLVQKQADEAALAMQNSSLAGSRVRPNRLRATTIGPQSNNV